MEGCCKNVEKDVTVSRAISRVNVHLKTNVSMTRVDIESDDGERACFRNVNLKPNIYALIARENLWHLFAVKILTLIN
jgi:hypothetical protein